mmetsp:Transcript_30268/g.67074  ORF Transcript_30268/g.67074 Transcript_30268/m.67074 type:complete len:442 (+) Transcript_30268:140-1465(+)
MLKEDEDACATHDDANDEENELAMTDSGTAKPFSSSVLKTGCVLSIIVAAVCLIPMYKENGYRFVQRYFGDEGGGGLSMDTTVVEGVSAPEQNGNSATVTSIANLAYTTAPFDIPYAKIDCQPCGDAGELMDPQAPYAIIGGAMKGGTRALLTYLSQHPDVYSDQGKEMHLLDNAKIQIFAHRDDPHCDQCEVLRTYSDIFKERRWNQRGGYSKNDKRLIFFDKSPSYLVMSHIVPQRMLCTFPHSAKVIFTLRNPVDRSYSHYQHCVHKHRHKEDNSECGGTFEDYIDKDYNGLLAAGVLNASSPIEEHETFVKYHHGKGNSKNFALAKSLYALTLRHWIAVFRDHFGQDEFLNHMLVIESERMREHKQTVFDETLEFLNMSPYELQTDEEYHTGSYDPMSDDTRQKLEGFFRPFNARLHEMLSPFGIEISWAKEHAALM